MPVPGVGHSYVGQDGHPAAVGDPLGVGSGITTGRLPIGRSYQLAPELPCARLNKITKWPRPNMKTVECPNSSSRLQAGLLTPSKTCKEHASRFCISVALEIWFDRGEFVFKLGDDGWRLVA